MLEGATLGRRFTLLHAVDTDLPGVERWVADDTRLASRVTVDLLRGPAPSAVRSEAAKAAQIRDARFVRVLSSGRHVEGDERLTYIVTERPRGLVVADVVGHHAVSPAVAAAIVGEVARALEVAAVDNIHHGWIRPSALTVTPTGRVVVAGLAVHGAIASQAGVSNGRTERADARALASLYVTAVTGQDVESVTSSDLPDGLGSAGLSMATAVIAGSPPATLAEIVRAMGPADSSALRRFARDSASAIVEVEPEPAPEPPAVTDELPTATASALPEESADHPTPDWQPVTSRHPWGRRDLDEPLETWETFAVEQNSGEKPSFWQAFTSWLASKFPRSTGLNELADRARIRAHKPAPLRAGPALLALLVVALFITGIVAFVKLTAEPDMESQDPHSGEHVYPSVTFSPEPLPSPSTWQTTSPTPEP